MKYSLVLLSFLLASCVNSHKQMVLIDPTFDIIVQQWHVDAIITLGHDIPIKDLVIYFGSLPNDNYDGLCHTAPNATPTITISAHYWYYLSPLGRQALIYHEMGHCVLGRMEHNNTMLEVTTPGDITAHQVYKSIMNMYSAVDPYYNTVEEPEVLNEYFGGQ